MRVLGLPVPFTGERQKAMNSVTENRPGWFRLFESFAGAWQTNTVVDRNLVLSYHAVYACITLIASDIAKLRMKLVEKDASGIWSETESPAYSPVLRKPNPIQTRIQFWESWIISKLIRGNTYAIKVRDDRRVVVGLYILDPTRVVPMISDDGEVFYQLSQDNTAGIVGDITVPASEIIHDRMNCLFHPLVGTSPIFAAGVAATEGLNIQNNSAQFFGNRAQPGGVLTAPGAISTETAERLKTHWDANYSGTKAGKIAVLGDGLEFKPMVMTSRDAQLIEQLKWTAEVVCSAFHVPPYKIGVGAMPSHNNVQALNVEYYSQCLQSMIEAAELCLDEGLGIGDGVKVGAGDGRPGRTYGTEFDIDGLLRMDSVSQLEALEKAKSVLTLDERRRKLDAKPIPGGATVYLQQQDHSIEAIAARDRQLIEQANAPKVETPLATADEPGPANDNMAEQAASAIAEFRKGLTR
ncbi:MAG: phage portal protein [Albidovulum sp.]